MKNEKTATNKTGKEAGAGPYDADDYFDEDALWEQHVHDRHVAREDNMGVPEDQR